MIKAGKFPGEAIIGIDDKNFVSSLSDCELDNSRIIVTLLHYDYPISEIGEQVFIKAIENGALHPREFATIYNFEKTKVSVLYKKSTKKHAELPDYQFNFPFGPVSADLKKVSSDRWEFGICKEEVDQKKAAICKKHGMKLDFGYR